MNREEFDNLLSQGLSVEQIVSFEDGKKPKDLPKTEQPAQEQPTIPTQPGGVMSRGVRKIMGGAPMEQGLTTQTLMQQGVPEVQPGQSLRDYQRTVAQQLQPREEQIISQGVTPQFENLVTAGLAGGVASHPASTLKGLAKFGMLEGVSNFTGLNKAIQSIPNADIRDLADLTKLGLQGALVTKSWGLDKLRTRFDVSKKLAQNYFNLKGPEGEEIAVSVAKEGIFAGNAKKYYKKLNTRKTELSKTLNSQFANATLNGTKVDLNYDNIIKPITDLSDSFQQYPELNRTSIRTLNKVWNDIFRNYTKLEESGDFSPTAVLNFKRGLGKEVSWDKLPANVDKKAIISAMRQVYRNIDTLLDKSVPGSGPINERLSNLIEATDALKSKIDKDPGLVRKLRRFDITRPGTLISPALEWTGTQSGLSKLLTPKYPTLPETTELIGK